MTACDLEKSFTLLTTSPPQSNLRTARRSSADKMSSKLLRSHSPSMLSPWLGVCVRMPMYAYCTKNDCFCAQAYRHLCLFCCVFALEFLFNPQFDLEPDYVIRKPPLCRIQRYILHREILSTFHTRIDNRSIRHFCKLPFTRRRSPAKSKTPIPSLTPLITPNGIPIQSAVSPQFTCADRQMGQVHLP